MLRNSPYPLRQRGLRLNSLQLAQQGIRISWLCPRYLNQCKWAHLRDTGTRAISWARRTTSSWTSTTARSMLPNSRRSPHQVPLNQVWPTTRFDWLGPTGQTTSWARPLRVVIQSLFKRLQASIGTVKTRKYLRREPLQIVTANFWKIRSLHFRRTSMLRWNQRRHPKVS